MQGVLKEVGWKVVLATLCATLAVLVAFGLTGCGSGGQSSSSQTSSSSSQASSASSSDTVPFTDSAGRTVQLPSTITRVAVTGPISQMALLTFAPDELVGLSNKLSDTEMKYVGTQYANLPVLGQIYGGKGDFNKEAVAQANPQVIIDIGEAKKTIVEDLDGIQAAIGIPCIHIEASFDTYDKAYEQLGELLGRQSRAKELADYCAKAYKDTNDVVSAIPADARVKVAYLLGDAGLNVMAKGSFQGTVVDLVADNVAVLEKAGGSGTGSETSFEQIALWNPQMIIFAPGSVYTTVGTDATWQSLSAISSGNYYEVPGEPYNWISSPPGVNQVLGLQWFARLCYPDKFTTSINDVAKDYFKTFYGYNLTDDECATLVAHSLPKK